MPLNMARPFKHSKTGVYWIRKVIPAHLRAAIGQREFKRSLRTHDSTEARRRAPAALAEFDARIAAAARGEHFGYEDLQALAGEYYRTRRRELLDVALAER